MRISVFGCGYLGAVHAACMAKLGHDVVGIDVIEAQVSALAEGRAPFHEPGLPELLAEALATGRLRFSTDAAQAADAEVHFVCVGTPQKRGENAADLRYVQAAVEDLLPHLSAGDVVVGKSTVPVGTAEGIAARLREDAPEVTLLWNPEFLREGHAVEDSLHPDRLVLGVESEHAYGVLREVYSRAIAEGVPVVRTDLETAELAKVSANVMLAARISLVNLLAEVCEAADADVADLTRVLGLDKRIGPEFLSPGIGYGGGCLPKDTRAFMARARELGVTESAALLREVDATNMRQRSRTVDLAAQMLGDHLAGARWRCWGRRSRPAPTTCATPPPSTSPPRCARAARTSWCTTPRRSTTSAGPGRSSAPPRTSNRR